MEENAKQNIRNYITDAGKRLAEKLNEEIARGNEDVAFFIALNIALFKDFQDIILALVGLGEIPLLGEILGLFCFVCLTLIMFQKGWFLKTRLRVMWWVLGFFIDNLPLFSILPIETLLVLYAWHLVKKRSKAAQKKLEILHKLTEKEIENLNNDIGLVDNQFTNQGRLSGYSKKLIKEAKTTIKSRTKEEAESAQNEITEKEREAKSIDGIKTKKSRFKNISESMTDRNDLETTGQEKKSEQEKEKPNELYDTRTNRYKKQQGQTNQEELAEFEDLPMQKQDKSTPILNEAEGGQDKQEFSMGDIYREPIDITPKRPSASETKKPDEDDNLKMAA